LEHTVEKALILSDGSSLGIHDFDLQDTRIVTIEQSTTLESMERNAIVKAIKLHSGNMSEVARHLGITRQTLYNKLRKYGL
ncbi:MAG: sigma-54-dependent Fis family transcriptional regulator, partial [Muribaculaceae bacterium]|nr:sigma-54-dependent Fis family transcriptional regulator [Muribaculaceae bacterium]